MLNVPFRGINYIHNVRQTSPLFLKFFPSPQTETLYPISNNAMFLLPTSKVGKFLSTVSLWIFPPLDFSSKWNHTISVLSCLAYFTQHHVPKIHSRYSSGNTFFLGWIILHSQDSAPFVCPFIKDTRVVTTFWLLWMALLLWTQMYWCLFESRVLVLCGTYLGVEVPAHVGREAAIFLQSVTFLAQVKPRASPAGQQPWEPHVTWAMLLALHELTWAFFIVNGSHLGLAAQDYWNVDKMRQEWRCTPSM